MIGLTGEPRLTNNTTGVASGTANTPSNALFIPSVIERDHNGYDSQISLTSRLFRDRIVFLGDYVTLDVANVVISEMLVLQQDSTEEDISLYINCMGGESAAISAIYDTMNFISNDVSTLCLGMANDASSILLSAGTKGKRTILPNATVKLSQPRFSGIGDKVSVLNVYADEMKRQRAWFTSTLHASTGKPEDVISRDLENGRILTAQQALDYGIVDTIIGVND